MRSPGGGEFRKERDRRKKDGVFYTPPPVARYLAHLCEHYTLSHRTAERLVLDPGDSSSPAGFGGPTIVDPACGDGALLWEAYQLECRRQGAREPDHRFGIVRRQLIGVDQDCGAVERLRQRFRLEFLNAVRTHELDGVLTANFRCGNAISGHGWEFSKGSATAEGFFHWGEQFPAIRAAGGFDVVIGNPPYRRERGAKSELQELQAAPFAAGQRQARMDLWHYFFHRSLDLLRPGGVLTFIVNSYWTTSHAGRPLIDRILAETTPLEIVLLDTAPVFAGVGGLHMIFCLRKGLTQECCRVVRLSEGQKSRVREPELWESIAQREHSSGTEVANAADTGLAAATWYTLARNQMFRKGRFHFEPPAEGEAARAPSMLGRTVGELFEVRQGIAENPPRVTRRYVEADPSLQTGEGVFVLNAAELRRLNLTPDEERLLRPYYTPAEITRYWVPAAPRQWLLYLTRRTAPDLLRLPQIARHLSRFRSLLEQRREVQLGRLAWWHLHWPREERLFETPRILAVQMGREPRFAFVQTATYVGFSVNLIVDSAVPSSLKMDDRPSLELLAVILNSKWAAQWFEVHAKRRGIKFDITGTALRQFPLFPVNPEIAAELLRLGRMRREHMTRSGGAACTPGSDSLMESAAAAVELQIDELIGTVYQANCDG